MIRIARKTKKGKSSLDIGMVLSVIIAVLIFACLAIGTPHLAVRINQEGTGYAGVYFYEKGRGPADDYRSSLHHDN